MQMCAVLGNIEERASKLRTLATKKVIDEPATLAVDQNGNKKGCVLFDLHLNIELIHPITASGRSLL